jgi:hypothetical protein
MQIVPRNELHPLPAWGCDPEGLIRNPKGQIVEALEVVPAEGIVRQWGCFNENDAGQHWKQKSPKIPVLFPDGVQLEFNTGAFDCVAYTVNALAQSMRLLRGELAKTGHTLDLHTRAEFLENDVWDRLSARGKQLGSLPSYNAYEDEKPLEVTDDNEKLRTGAGHIHFGFEGNEQLRKNLPLLAKICDSFIGMPSVMMDPDPKNALRRTMYGRAGEYRPQPHGFEYRTPSNFWLASGPLAGFIFGAARLALAVYQRELRGENVLQKIYASGLDQALVRRAINANDVALATEQFEKLKPFITETCQRHNDGFWPAMLPAFDWFTKQVQEKGVQFFWPDTLKHWCELPEAHNYGWTWFMEEKVPGMMKGQDYAA